jgi:DNA-binding SARP family transcriptional activator
VDKGSASSISARKIETLLVTLLIRSDQVVAADRLIMEIWGERAPRRATAGLHVYISDLRKFLRRPQRPASPIVTRPPGYLLHLGADELDAHLFVRMMDEGRAHSRQLRHEEAADSFERALSLWRGPVVGDLSGGPIVDGFLAWLAEARLECTELLVDVQLKLGRHRELVAQLFSLAAEHPLRETFYRQLMLALYRSDRKADALKVYQSARRTLEIELGLEPCRALQDLQRAILVADDELLGLQAAAA